MPRHRAIGRCVENIERVGICMECPLIRSWALGARDVHLNLQIALEPLSCRGFRVAGIRSIKLHSTNFSLDKGAIPFGAILGNYIKINGIRFLGGRIFPLISLKNPVESGVWCAEAPGIKGLVGVGGVHSTQNAIGASVPYVAYEHI